MSCGRFACSYNNYSFSSLKNTKQAFDEMIFDGLTRHNYFLPYIFGVTIALK
jgi:hypothetical protein